MLAQFGTYGWGELGFGFGLDMTRQLSFYGADGEYDHMAQLSCTFLYEPSEPLRALGNANLWSFGMPLREFFDTALAMAGFAEIHKLGVEPVQLAIGYSDV